ncbi:hypothetical protein ACFS07_17210 [Undibacterium arcticum]
MNAAFVVVEFAFGFIAVASLVLGPRFLLGRHGQFRRFVVLAPTGQMRRVNSFAPQQRSDIAGVGAIVGQVENAMLLSRTELASLREGHDHRIRTRRAGSRISSRPSLRLLEL